MTSSGTTSFSPSNGELVLAAYERIQVRATSLRQEHMLSARRELNFLFSEWANKQVNLWKVLRAQTTLVEGTKTYTYNAKTIMILDASIVLNYGDSDETRRYIPPISRTEYLSFANQQVQGAPTTYWFDRIIAPTVTFWPVPDGNGPYTFDYFYVSQIEDANLSGGETPDVPYRWFDCIVAGLAHRLARIYAPQLELQRKADAQESWTNAASQDIENVNVKINPSLSGYYGR